MGAASRDFNCVAVQMPEKNFEYTEKEFRLNGKEFELPVAISDSNDVPPILGRTKGLDLFDANFSKGEKVKFRWEE